MKNSVQKRKITQFNASRGAEREIALKKVISGHALRPAWN